MNSDKKREPLANNKVCHTSKNPYTKLEVIQSCRESGYAGYREEDVKSAVEWLKLEAEHCDNCSEFIEKIDEAFPDLKTEPNGVQG